METNENELGNGAIPESQVNVAAREVDISDVSGGKIGRSKIDPWDVLSL